MLALRFQVIGFIGLSWLLGSALLAQNESSDTGTPAAYVFIGGELSAAQGKGHFPVVAMTTRHILVDHGTGVKKVSKSSSILLQLKPTLSKSIVEISNFDFSFSSSLPSRIEAQAVSEMLRHQLGTEQEIANMAKIGGGGPRSRLNYDAIEELTQETKEYQEGLLDHADQASDEAEDRVDTLHLKFDIFPEEDYADAYIAVAVSFDLQEFKGLRRGSQVFGSFVGSLRAERAETVRIRLSLRPFFRMNSVCEVFLFHGEGIPIATNRSRLLQALSEEQLEEITNRSTGVQ